MSNVFISYSHTDNDTADAIVAILEELEIPYFRDERDINWGDPITPTVREGLEKSGALIVIMSPGSLKSDWVHFEVGYAMALQKRVLPFLTHPSLDLPGYIKDLLHVQSQEQIRAFFLSNPDWSAPTREAEIEESGGEEFQKAVEMMPDLLAVMKDDLSNPNNQLIRKFVLLESKAFENAIRLPKDHFVYYGDVHQRLREKVDMLVEELGLVRVVDYDYGGQGVEIYRMTEEFVQAIINWS